MRSALGLLFVAACVPGVGVFGDKAGTTPGTAPTTTTTTPGTPGDADTDADADADADTDTVTTPTTPTDPNPPAWVVDCNGGGDFTTIQAAIDAARSGDRIGVKPCTYRERLDWLGKTLEVYGTEGSAVTVLDAQGQGTAVNVEHGEGLGTRFAGFTVQNGSDDEEGSGAEVREAVLELDDVVFTGNSPSEHVIHAVNGMLDLRAVTVTGNGIDATGAAIYSDGGALTVDASTIDCGAGADAIYHHNQLTLADSVVSCAGGNGVHTHHGEASVRRSTVSGGVYGIYAYDYENLPELPDSPSEHLALSNSSFAGGVSGGLAKWMHATVESCVFSGKDAGLAFVGMDPDTLARNSGFVNAACGISADVDYAFSYNGFWNTGDTICGATGSNTEKGDPMFAGAPADLHLLAGSAWIDAGNPGAAYNDADGTRADIGMYGGPLPPP